MSETFDTVADAYDAWYDSQDGSAIFKAELACFRCLIGHSDERWLEIGVGTGRFAANLGISEGIDPSPRMLEKATDRGIKTYQAHAESLPFPNNAFDGAFLALSLCFVDHAEQALRECFRVVHPEGHLLIGLVPADSPWGKAYQEKANAGHQLYAHAHFRTTSETVTLVEDAGFNFQHSASTLFWKPKDAPETSPHMKHGIIPDAGFVALLFTKPEVYPETDTQQTAQIC